MNIILIERYLYLIIPNFLLRRILPFFSKFKFFEDTKLTQTPITFNLWYNQMVIGHCRNVYWPVHNTSYVYNPRNIYCGIETSPGFSQGNYIQAIGKIYIGDYTQIAANVGIISANHDLEDNRKHIIKEVKIGKYCWIGFGAVIMPGVEFGDYTIVGAGAVVTKSFPEGFCVIGGNPARMIKQLDKEKCVFHKSEFEYNGYIKNSNFEEFRKKNLNI
jgi:acetyltransferase-like isoleucine patch superfamily enzyme